MNPTPLDPAALLEHEGFVRRLARDLVGPGAEAEDVAQDTWLAALQHPPRLVGALRSYLGRILHNSVTNAGHARRRRSRREQAAARGEGVPDASTMHAGAAARWGRRGTRCAAA